MARWKCGGCGRWGADRCQCTPQRQRPSKTIKQQTPPKNLLDSTNKTSTTATKTTTAKSQTPRTTRTIATKTTVESTTSEPKGLGKKQSLELELQLEPARVERLRLESARSAARKARKTEKEAVAARLAKTRYWNGWSSGGRNASWSSSSWSREGWFSKGDQRNHKRDRSWDVSSSEFNFPPSGLVWNEAELSAYNYGCN